MILYNKFDNFDNVRETDRETLWGKEKESGYVYSAGWLFNPAKQDSCAESQGR